VIVLVVCLGGFFAVVASVRATAPPGPAEAKTTAAASQGAGRTSGLEGTTSSIVISGVRGGPTTGGPTRMEFAVAPIDGDRPAYERATFVQSDRDGRYKVALPPGKYWVGPKAKALDPTHYRPRAIAFREQEAVVTEGSFTHLDLSEVGYAP
jgi:hypothetical protein